MERVLETLKLKIGEKAPYFSLPATDGKIYSLKDFTGKTGLCVIFTCNHCPYVKAVENSINEIAREYLSKDIQFIAICANDSVNYPEDSFERMIEKSTSENIPYPYLHDASQSIAKAYDAACTPEVYLFDKETRLFYQGQINDIKPNKLTASEHYLRDALAALLSNETPPQQIVPAIGCSIKWK